MNDVLEAILWTLFISTLSQVASVAVVAFLGVPPKQLPHEIEDKQNAAVGALFFIISTIFALYFSQAAGDGYDPTGSSSKDLLWVVGGFVGACLMSCIAFWLAHLAMQPLKGEGVLGYIRREIVDEQNTALAFFLGGLAIVPFMATIYQIL